MDKPSTRIDFTDRHIWVMGAGGGGIGTAMCRDLVAAGASVHALDRDDSALDATREAVAELREDGSHAGTLACHEVDALDRKSIESFAREARARGEAATGLVNVVGGLGRDQFGSIIETEEDVFDRVIDLNLRSAWLSSQAFAREARNGGHGGSVVYVASIVALQAMPFGASYAAAKAALLSLSRTQALEWGPLGIRVNAVAAGTIHTPRSASVDAERDRRAIPLGHRGSPTDIAGAALFFLSDLAGWVTGQVVAVDGGVSIKPAYLDETGLPVFVDDAEMRRRLTNEEPR